MIFFSGRFLGETNSLGDIEGLEGLPLGQARRMSGRWTFQRDAVKFAASSSDDKVAETEGGVDLGHRRLWDCVDCCGRHLGGDGDGPTAVACLIGRLSIHQVKNERQDTCSPRCLSSSRPFPILTPNSLHHPSSPTPSRRRFCRTGCTSFTRGTSTAVYQTKSFHESLPRLV